MGNCTPEAGCCTGESDEFSAEVFMLRTSKFNKEDLNKTEIEIGVKGFISPLTRSALLNENFSHIYGHAF